MNEVREAIEQLSELKLEILIKKIKSHLPELPQDFSITGDTKLNDIPGFNEEILQRISVELVEKEIIFVITPGASVKDFLNALTTQRDIQQTTSTYHKIKHEDYLDFIIPKKLPKEHIIGYPVRPLDPDLKERYGLTDEQIRGYFINNKAKPAVDATAAAEAPVGGQEPIATGESPVVNDQLIDPLPIVEGQKFINPTLLPPKEENLIKPTPPLQETNIIKPTPPLQKKNLFEPIAGAAKDLHVGSTTPRAIEALLRIFGINNPQAKDGKGPDASPDQATSNNE